jgi:hypothetical protein
MLAWLSDAFASNSDRARLIAIVISAVIAIVVLLLNQHFTTKRAKKELLIKKIEEAYQSALSYEKNAKQLLTAINKGERDQAGNFYLDPALIGAMNDDVEKLEMLIGLYFPNTPFDRDKYYASPSLPVLEIAIKKQKVSEAEAIDAAERTRDIVKRNTSEIKGTCLTLMNQYRH